jgi:hypothetical protein
MNRPGETWMVDRACLFWQGKQRRDQTAFVNYGMQIGSPRNIAVHRGNIFGRNDDL